MWGVLPPSFRAARKDMTTWFTSDEHHWHANIIRYSKRPFSSIVEMTEELVRRHNAVVKAEDTVWHLGDFSMD